MPLNAGKFDVLVQVQDSTPADWGTPLTATRKFVLTVKECSNGIGPGPFAKAGSTSPEGRRPRRRVTP